MRNVQQTKEYYASRKITFEKKISEQSHKLFFLLDDKERLATTKRIQLAKNQIAKIDRECNERLSFINEDKQLRIDNKLISLNLITII